MLDKKIEFIENYKPSKIYEDLKNYGLKDEARDILIMDYEEFYWNALRELNKRGEDDKGEENS